MDEMPQVSLVNVSDVETWRALWETLIKKMKDDKLEDGEIMALVECWVADLAPPMEEEEE